MTKLHKQFIKEHPETSITIRGIRYDTFEHTTAYIDWLESKLVDPFPYCEWLPIEKTSEGYIVYKIGCSSGKRWIMVSPKELDTCPCCGKEIKYI